VTIPEIDVTDLEPLHRAGASIVDVRQPDEYDEAHVPGAVLIPLGEVPDRAAELPTDGTIYLICKSGARSQRAGDFLAGQGYDVVNVAGGTMAWIDAGFGVDTGGAG
jgi:rhodanese-related sulfurtransferase